MKWLKLIAGTLSGLTILALSLYSAAYSPGNGPKPPGAFGFSYSCLPGDVRVVAVSPSDLQTGEPFTIYGCGFQPGATVYIGNVQVAGPTRPGLPPLPTAVISQGGQVLTATWTSAPLHFHPGAP